MNMHELQKSLAEAAHTLIKLSCQFDRMEMDYVDLFSEQYPFSVRLHQVIFQMLKWRDHMNELMERSGT